MKLDTAMSDVSRKKESVIKVIRSLLISSPSGLTLSQLERDYQSVENQGLPYRKFGHTDLLSFVKTLSDVVRIDFRNRELVLYGIADEKTKHIKSMVDHQRKTSRYMGLTKVNQPPRRPKSGSAIARGVGYASAAVRRNIFNVVQANVNGVPMSVFLDVYKQENGVALNPERLGFRRLPDLFLSMPDVCKLEYGRRDRTGNSLYVYPPKSQQRQAGSPPKKKNTNDSKLLKPLDAEKKNTNLKDSDKLIEEVPNKIITNTTSEPKPHHCKETFNTQVIPTCQLLKSEILEILAEEAKGIWAVRVPILYKKKFGKELQIKKLGYFSLIEFLSTLSDQVSITRPNPKGDWLLAKRISNAKEQSDSFEEGFFSEGFEITKMEVKEMLIKSKDGILLHRLPEIYEKTYRHKLHLEEYNIPSTLQFAVMISGVCIYEKDRKLYVTLTTDEKKAVLGGYVPPKSAGENDIPVDAVGMNASYKLPTLPSKDAQYVDLFVSDVTTPNYFMVQICSKKTTGALNKLMDELERFYCSPESDKYKIPDCMVSIGQLCAAVFMEDMNWHRAVIVHINKASYADVLYVDYGSISAVPIASLRLLKACFINLPSQMIKARLAHIQPINLESWTLNSRNCMLDMCRDRPLVAMITNIEDRVLSLCLCDTTHPDTDLHINDTLVEKKHAVYFPDDLTKEAANTLRSFLRHQMEIEKDEGSNVKGPNTNTQLSDKFENLTGNLNAGAGILSNTACLDKGPIADEDDKLDLAEKKVAPMQKRFVRKFSIIEDQYSIYVINYEGNAMVTSADISRIFQQSTDVLVPLLLMKNLKFVELVVGNDEKHSQLFIELRQKMVPGTIERNMFRSMVCLYRLQDIPSMVRGIGHDQEKDLIDGLERICKAFDPDSSYWILDDDNDCPELVSVAKLGQKMDQLERQKEKLFFERKTLLELLANQSSSTVVDQITEIEEKLYSLKEKINELSSTLPKQVGAQAEDCAVHDAMVSQYNSHTGEKHQSNSSSQACAKSEPTRVAEVVPFNISERKVDNSNVDTDFDEIPDAHISHDIVDFTSQGNSAGDQLPPLINGSSGTANWTSPQMNNQVMLDRSDRLQQGIFIPQTMQETTFPQPQVDNIPYISPQPQRTLNRGTQAQLPIAPPQWHYVPVAQQGIEHNLNAAPFFPRRSRRQMFFNQMGIPVSGAVGMPQRPQQLVYNPQVQPTGQYSLFMPIQGIP